MIEWNSGSVFSVKNPYLCNSNGIKNRTMIPRRNAIVLAEANRAQLHQQYDAACKRLADAHKQIELDEFLFQIALWTVSMNMREDDLAFFLELGWHRNIVHKTVDEREAYLQLGGSRAQIPSLQATMELNDPKWYPKRIAYRATIQNEENFKYGALYAGGEGLSKYGHYTVILKRDAVQTYTEMLILWEDSLMYVDKDYIFDELRYAGGLACKDNSQELAVVKHESDLYAGCSQAISRLCYANTDADRSYLEIQVGDPVLASHIDRIRMNSSFQRELLKIAEEKFCAKFDFSKAQDRGEVNHWTKYQQLSIKVRTLGLEIEKLT